MSVLIINDRSHAKNTTGRALRGDQGNDKAGNASGG